jgi:hypothetical protein
VLANVVRKRVAQIFIELSWHTAHQPQHVRTVNTLPCSCLCRSSERAGQRRAQAHGPDLQRVQRQEAQGPR